MTKYNTGNPVGSTAVKDLYDNAENLDEAVNTRTAESWDDRFGVARKTWWGMEQDFQQFLINSGYQNIGDYGPGLEITARNQIFWRDGELYRAGAALELPYTTTGDWGAEEGLFVAVGDQALRQDLVDPSEGSLVVASSTVRINSIKDLIDLPLEFLGRNQIYQVVGYHSGTTVGGGFFIYDAFLPKSLHDGGYYIDNERSWNGLSTSFHNFLVKDDGASGLGVFKRVNVEKISTSMYGASEDFPLTVEASYHNLQNSFYIAGVLGKDLEVSSTYEGWYEVESSNNIRINMEDSHIYFKAGIKMVQGSSNLLDGILKFVNCKNTTVHNILIDGNRDENILATQRGTQSSITVSIDSENMTFTGGTFLNALQNHIISYANNLIIDNIDFENSGEHGLYLTLIANRPREKVTVKNSNIINYGIDIGSVGLSIRDYRRVLIDNCRFVPGTNGEAWIQGYTEYNSQLEPGEQVEFHIRNSSMFLKTDGGILPSGIAGLTTGKSLIRVDSCYLEYSPRIVQVTGRDISFNNCTFDCSKATNPYNRPYLPPKADNCVFIAGAGRFETPANAGESFFYNRCTFNGENIDGAVGTYSVRIGDNPEKGVFSNCVFDNCVRADLSGIGVLSNVNLLLLGNTFTNGNGAGIRLVTGTNTRLVSNGSISSDSITLQKTATPVHESGSYFD